WPPLERDELEFVASDLVWRCQPRQRTELGWQRRGFGYVDLTFDQSPGVAAFVNEGVVSRRQGLVRQNARDVTRLRAGYEGIAVRVFEHRPSDVVPSLYQCRLP